MRRKLFISYRRDDAKAEARSIYQHMAHAYGAERIFMDVDSIQKGLDFSEVLQQSLEQTAVMIVVMGRTWLTATDEHGRERLKEPSDYVHMEIAKALASGIPVIPVRVDGSRLPRSEELPPPLQPLTRRQGTIVTHESFDSDIRGLEADVGRFMSNVPAGGNRATGLIAAGLAAVLAAGGGWFYWSQLTPGPSMPPLGAAAGGIVDKSSAAALAAAAWAEARQKNSIEAYRTYLRTFPTGGHRKEAADAAILLVYQTVEGRLDKAVASVKRNDGSLNGYVSGLDPRVMAMCIEWAGSSHENLLVHGWGSSQFVSNAAMTIQERDKIALSFCSNNAMHGKRCTCEIVHRNGKAVMSIPKDWAARQLR